MKRLSNYEVLELKIKKIITEKRSFNLWFHLLSAFSLVNDYMTVDQRISRGNLIGFL